MGMKLKRVRITLTKKGGGKKVPNLFKVSKPKKTKWKF